MASSAEPVVRDADHDDVAAICRFGEAHIRPHYAPPIGAEAEGLVVVAEADGRLVGVGQRGCGGADHVVYKLYVHPSIAAVVWAPSYLRPSPGSRPLTLIGCISNTSWPTSA